MHIRLGIRSKNTLGQIRSETIVRNSPKDILDKSDTFGVKTKHNQIWSHCILYAMIPYRYEGTFYALLESCTSHATQEHSSKLSFQPVLMDILFWGHPKTKMTRGGRLVVRAMSRKR